MANRPGMQIGPSGEDANPLHKRLPAEVIRRQPRQQRKVVEEVKPEEETVKVDLRAAIAARPDKRPKWLEIACKMAAKGEASKTELYSIICSRKFVGGLKKGVGLRLREVVVDNLDLFSDKQQRYLKSDEWVLNTNLSEQMRPEPEEGDEDAPLDSAEPEKDSRDAEKERRRAEADSAFRERADAEEVGGGWAVVNTKGTEHVHREAKLQEERARRKKQDQDKEKFMAVEAESQSKKKAEKEEEKRRQIEDEMDSMLEGLGQPREEERPRGRDKKRAASRSISVQRSRSRKRKKEDKKQKAASRDDFEAALRRRMQDRERNDTTRMHVVDPDHAKRWST